MKRSIIIAALLTFCIASLAHAQARVQGVIKNEEGKPVVGATVFLSNPAAPQDAIAPTTSNKSGKWAALLPMGGSWDIDVEAEGYITSRGTMQISAGGRTPALETVLKKVPPPVVVEETVVSTVPDEAVAAVEAGEQFMKDRKWAEAASEFEAAHALLPDHVQIKQVLAQSYYQLDRKEEAMALLQEVHAEQPENLGVLLLLTNVLLEEGKLEEGKVMLTKIPDEALADPTALINVAILFLNRGDQQESLNYLDKAIAASPEFPESYYYRGLIYLQMGNMNIGKKEMASAKKNFELAKENLNKVIELGPETAEAGEAAELMEQIDIQMKNM